MIPAIITPAMQSALTLCSAGHILIGSTGVHHKTAKALIDRGLAKQLKSGLLTITAAGKKAMSNARSGEVH